MRIAQINDCRVCQTFRAPRDVVGRFDEDSVPEEVYEHVGDPSWSGFSDRERLAMEFAERFALDHVAMSEDAALWERLHAALLRRRARRAGVLRRRASRQRAHQPRLRRRRRLLDPARHPLPRAGGRVRLRGARTDGRRSPRQRAARQAARRARPEDRAGRGVPRRAVRLRPRVRALPRRPRWARGRAEAAGGGQPAARGGGRTDRVRRATHRVRHGRAHDRHPRHRGAEASVPAAAVHRRRDVVPAVQRAGRGLRRRRPLDHAPTATATSGS